MRRRDWEDFGGFDCEFLMHGEDTGLCMRAMKKWTQPIVTPDATIIHHGGGSEQFRLDRMVCLFDVQVLLLQCTFLRLDAGWSTTRCGSASLLVWWSRT